MLPNGSHLSFGGYQEESRPLRRMLKQVGGGSIAGGLLAVQQDQNALRALASALCIDTKVAAPACCMHRANPGSLCWPLTLSQVHAYTAMRARQRALHPNQGGLILRPWGLHCRVYTSPCTVNPAKDESLQGFLTART